jgi:hypothetical protein
VRLGIEQATDQLVHLGDRPGAAHRGRKLRIWFGHVRQRDRICGELLVNSARFLGQMSCLVDHAAAVACAA